MQLCLVKSGAVYVCLSDKKLELKAGEGCFINSGMLHMIAPVEDPDSTYYCIDFLPALLSLFPGSIFEKRYIDPYVGNPAFAEMAFGPSVPWQDEILTRLQTIADLAESKLFGYEYQVAECLMQIWLSLLQNFRPDAAKKTVVSRARNDAVARAIMTYVQAHYKEEITIDAIAEAVHYSPGECCRLFKRVTHDTIFSYIRLYRITQASKLLRETGLSVEDIATECGFASASYFISAFKKCLKTTPLRYRNGA
jgi:AraC-like DNA-binding protein